MNLQIALPGAAQLSLLASLLAANAGTYPFAAGPLRELSEIFQAAADESVEEGTA